MISLTLTSPFKMKLALALLLVATAFAQEDGGCLDSCSEDYDPGTEDLDKCALGCELDACDGDFECGKLT